jgi:hypothetical protein
MILMFRSLDEEDYKFCIVLWKHLYISREAYMLNVYCTCEKRFFFVRARWHSLYGHFLGTCIQHTHEETHISAIHIYT